MANQPLQFTNAKIINYFVIRDTVDGLLANDTKAIDDSAQNIFLCGHIQGIKMCTNQHLAIEASCIPEMKKDCVYLLHLQLDNVTLEIISAKCGARMQAASM